MSTNFKDMQEAMAAGFMPVNRKGDKDISRPNSFGYRYQNGDGVNSVHVYLAEELNQMRRPGAVIPMYPPANAVEA